MRTSLSFFYTIFIIPLVCPRAGQAPTFPCEKVGKGHQRGKPVGCFPLWKPLSRPPGGVPPWGGRKPPFFSVSFHFHLDSHNYAGLFVSYTQCCPNLFDTAIIREKPIFLLYLYFQNNRKCYVSVLLVANKIPRILLRCLSYYAYAVAVVSGI